MGLDVSLFVDGIICDYNYVFDPRVKLKRYFGEGAKGEFLFLVDEAHNLVEMPVSLCSLLKMIPSVHVPLTVLNKSRQDCQSWHSLYHYRILFYKPAVPGYSCQEVCPYAKGHYDRINEAVYDCITHEMNITREVLLEYANASFPSFA